jgi:flagellar biosynthesis anti-sigma factor FlgM
MKINTNYNQFKKINEIQKNNIDKSKNERSSKSEKAKQNSVLDSKLLSHLDQVKDSEIFRQDRVDAIKQQLKDGNYQINYDVLADKFLED